MRVRRRLVVLLLLALAVVACSPGPGAGGRLEGTEWIVRSLAVAGQLTIAEDHRSDPALTSPTSEGGAGFGAQWDSAFLHGLRPALVAASDKSRDMRAVEVAIIGEGRGAPLTRVIYTESHDDVANGQVRVPESVKY